MAMMIEILNDPEVPPRKRVLAAELVVRGSTGPRSSLYRNVPRPGLAGVLP
jgi:hypothetical protein